MSTDDTTSAQGLLTLADVAVLARVQRPVVSMWRQRPHRDAGPFPRPARVAAGVAQFDRDEVVGWLAASGRGNNPDVAIEAVLQSRPPTPTPSGRDLAEALLLVRAASGESLTGLDVEDLLDVTDDVDPHDRFAWSEVAQAEPADVLASAAYVEALAAASFGVWHALTHLRRDPSRFGLPPEASAPADAVLACVGAVVDAVARSLGDDGGDGDVDGAPIADPTGCSAPVVLATMAAAGQEAGSVLLRPAVPSDGEARRLGARAAWRTLLARGIDPTALAVDEAGHAAVDVPAVLVAGFPHTGAPAMTPGRLLDAVDDVVLQLDDTRRAIILGPASVLTDALGGRGAQQARRRILDSGRLRALVRFDVGSVPAIPNRRMALWVLGPAPEGFRQGRTAVADLAGLDLADVTDDLVSDIVAALEDRPVADGIETQGHAHVFRVARYQRTFTVLARDGDLVPRDVRVPAVMRRPAPGEERVRRAVDLAARVALPEPVEVRPPVAVSGRVTTIRELLAQGLVRVVSGTRLRADEPRPAAEHPSGVAVVGLPELSGTQRPGGRVVDLLTFTAAHPRATRTEAGDVVFCTGPTPAAWVDARGGSVVEYPARVIRAVDRDGHSERVVPRVLAADLARGSGTQWRAYGARVVPVVEADTLTQVLESIAVAREDALRRARDLEQLTELLADGTVVAQSPTMMNPLEPEGH